MSTHEENDVTSINRTRLQLMPNYEIESFVLYYAENLVLAELPCRFSPPSLWFTDCLCTSLPSISSFKYIYMTSTAVRLDLQIRLDGLRRFPDFWLKACAYGKMNNELQQIPCWFEHCTGRWLFFFFSIDTNLWSGVYRQFYVIPLNNTDFFFISVTIKRINFCSLVNHCLFSLGMYD